MSSSGLLKVLWGERDLSSRKDFLKNQISVRLLKVKLVTQKSWLFNFIPYLSRGIKMKQTPQTMQSWVLIVAVPSVPSCNCSCQRFQWPASTGESCRAQTPVCCPPPVINLRLAAGAIFCRAQHLPATLRLFPFSSPLPLFLERKRSVIMAYEPCLGGHLSFE